jgi:hypothetical protein
MDRDDTLTLIRTLTRPVLELFAPRRWLILKTPLPLGP